MNSPLFKLYAHDFFKGAVTAIFTAVVAVLYGIVMQAGFDVFGADWVAIGKLAFNSGFVSFFGYLGKNFLTAKDGTVAGI